MKSTLIIFFLSLILFIAEHNTGNINFSCANISNSRINNCDDTYIYMRILKDGVWWIIVSTSDGLVIDEYPDPDQ